jgi:protein-S-isoprenylcysteine O-methyltransferase Ste14
MTDVRASQCDAANCAPTTALRETLQVPRSLPEFKGSKRIWILTSAAIGAVIGAYLTRDAPPAHSLDEFLSSCEQSGFPLPMLLSIALWVVLSIYWEISATKAAAKVSSESSRSRAVHVFLTGISQLLVLFPVTGLRMRFIPQTFSLIVVGLVIEVASLSLAIWARHRLGRNWSGAIATNVDHQFVRSGPYRFVRHPIYTGILGLSAGTTIVSGELHALIGMGLISLAYWRKIRMEEAHLRELFGPAYDDYRATSWALLPGVF